MISLAAVCLLAKLRKTIRAIFSQKFGRKVTHRPRKKPFDFGEYKIVFIHKSW